MPSPETKLPLIIASTMATGGLIDGTHLHPDIPSEAIAFRWIDLSPSQVRGVHAPLDYDRTSLKHLLITVPLSLKEKAARTVLFYSMKDTRRLVKELSQNETPRYLVLHPDAAAGLLLDLIDGRVTLPPHLTPAIENDQGTPVSFQLNKLLNRFHLPLLFTDPCSPATIGFLADAFEALCHHTDRILDLEHLQTSHPDMTLTEAVALMGGVNILHLSGPDHQGLTEDEVLSAIHSVIALNPPHQRLHTVVLEGPAPQLFLLPTPKEARAFRHYYHALTQKTDK